MGREEHHNSASLSLTSLLRGLSPTFYSGLLEAGGRFLREMAR